MQEDTLLQVIVVFRHIRIRLVVHFENYISRKHRKRTLFKFYFVCSQNVPNPREVSVSSKTLGYDIKYILKSICATDLTFRSCFLEETIQSTHFKALNLGYVRKY